MTRYINSTFLWLAIIVLAFYVEYEHERITNTQDKAWQDNREIERQAHCIDYLYQRVDFHEEITHEQEARR